MKWQTVALAEVATVISGFAFDSVLFNDEKAGLPIARIRDVVRGFSTTNYSGSYKELYRISDGDVLIGMDGEFNIGKWKGGDAVLNQRVCKVIPKMGRIDSNYLFRFLPDALQVIEDATPFVTVKHLSARQILGINIPLPPFAEQQRIAAILDKADALRQKRREALAQLDRLLQAVFVDMFGDPVTNPKGWPIRSLSGVSHVQGGLQLSAKRSPLPLKKPYLRVANVQRGRLNLTEIKQIGLTPQEFQKTLLQKNDLLIVEGNGNPDEIGRAALWSGAISGCVHQNHLIRVRVDPKSLVPEYLGQFVNSDNGKQYFSKIGRTTSGLVTISTGIVKALPIPTPPIAEQQRFASAVRQAEALRVRQQAAQTESDALFASLQTRAFAGKL